MTVESINYQLQLTEHYYSKIESELEHDTVAKLKIGNKELCVIKLENNSTLCIWNKDGSQYAFIKFEDKVLDDIFMTTIKRYINHLVYIWKG